MTLCTLKREMHVYNPCYEDINYTTKHIVNKNIILYSLKFQCLQCHCCCTGRWTVVNKVHLFLWKVHGGCIGWVCKFLPIIIIHVCTFLSVQGFKPSADAVAATSAGGFTILSEKKLFLGQKVSHVIFSSLFVTHCHELSNI